MFLRFFLSFNDFSKSGFSSSIQRTKNQATDANNYKIPLKHKVTFDSVLISLITSMNRESQFNFNYNYTREILINLSDEAMFQLETTSVSEYCYCTYNLSTKMIGFGNTMNEAFEASASKNSQGSFVSRGSVNSNKSLMIQFYKYAEPTEDEDMEFTCPDGFYEQVLNELKPYIVFEKRFFFKQCTDILEREANYIDEYLLTYFDSETNKIQYFGTSIPINQFKHTVYMFMNDDSDIFSHKDEHESGLCILGALCLKIMQMTNETF